MKQIFFFVLLTIFSSAVYSQDINSIPITIKPDQIVIKLNYDRKVNSWGSKNKNWMIKFKISNPMLDTIRVDYIQDNLTIDLLDSSYKSVQMVGFKIWDRRPWVKWDGKIPENKIKKDKIRENKYKTINEIKIKGKNGKFIIHFPIWWSNSNLFGGHLRGYRLEKGTNFIRIAIVLPDKKLLKGMIPLIVK